MAIFSDNRIMENVYDDIGFEDITTNSLVSEDKWAQAEIKCKADGILAGMDVAHYIIDQFNLNISNSYLDGDEIHKGDIILEFEGRARDILMAERTILNYLILNSFSIYFSLFFSTISSSCLLAPLAIAILDISTTLSYSFNKSFTEYSL